MTTAVTYWVDGEVRHLEGAWERMPGDDALWVWIEVDGARHRLLGADGYWVHGLRYGCTYEDAEPIYGGALYTAWAVTEGEMIYLGDVPPPEGAHVIRGVELPDEVWLRVLAEHS